jgi:hypothetical protein
LGRLYLINDSLEKNLKKAEAEIGDKSREAVLALHGSRLAMLGGGTEVVGVVLRDGAKQIMTAAYPASLTHKMAQNVFGTGMRLARTGAVIGAVAGFYDAGQARIASIRTSVAGDKRARDQHIAATITYGIGSGVAVYAVYSATFIGPLGWAIILTLGAYILSRKAEKSESTSLERWARRCYFGIANETPKIHWNDSTSADIAFAELNAATSGLSIAAKFEHNNTDPIVNPRAGRIQNSPSTQHLKFRLSLPQFDAQTSGYQWTFIIHRFGDGPAPNYTSGEIVCSGNFHPPQDRLLHPRLRPSKPPRAPDYIKESISVRENSHHTTIANKQQYYYMEINGTLELIPEIAKNNIEAATLSVTYWPDRGIPDGYAEITVQVQNK